jgi:hypothetical protein
MTRKEQLQQRIEAADADRVELWRIESQETEDRNRALIGKCFKYRTSYSLPKQPEDYWWMYLKILGVDGTSLRIWRFDTDKYGKIQIEPDSRLAHQCLSIGYHEIPPAEFNAAWQATMERLEKL